MSGRPSAPHIARWMTVLVAVAAMLWQSVVPLFAPALKPADDLVVVCTAHGLKTVSLSAQAGSDNSKSQQEPPAKTECPLCPAGHAGAVCLPGGAPLQVAEAALTLTVSPAEQRAVFGPTRFESFHSRAPPFVG
jgi:hypothetical protein